MPEPTPPSPDKAPEAGTPPPADGDPRLAIPEVLRETPAKRAARLGGTEPEARQPASAMVETAKAWGMALDLVFSSLGMFALGYLFDLWRGTGPWGALVGLVLGFVTSAVRMVRTTMRQEARKRAAKR
ncbi:MAG: AtpZ/AtpI family protein [Phycisphaerales bacterium JB041]